MNILGKIFAVLVFGMSVVFVGVTASYLAVSDNFRQKFVREAVERVRQRDSAQEVAAKYQAAVRMYTSRDEMARKEVERHIEAKKVALHHLYNMEATFQTLSQDIASVRKDIGTINTEVQGFSDTAERLSKENKKSLKSEINARRERDLVRVTAARLRRDYAKVKDAYDDIQTKFWEKSRMLEDVAQENQQLRTMIPDADVKLAEGIGRQVTARVVAVDEEVGLVVLSAGQADQVVVGQRFVVYRDDRYKTLVKVERVYPNQCAAVILVDHSIRRVEAGDDAISEH